MRYATKEAEKAIEERINRIPFTTKGDKMLGYVCNSRESVARKESKPSKKGERSIRLTNKHVKLNAKREEKRARGKNSSVFNSAHIERSAYFRRQ